jgi:glycine cleavage system H protein
VSATAHTLTGLDFPPGLLYGRRGQWVRDDEAGAVRLGLNPLASPDAEEVVFVQLPAPGERLVRGEPFGVVELPHRSVPLIAPVNGEVLAPNVALEDTPELVAGDPYGEGYLLDVEGVHADELRDLLGREEATLHYSDVALELPFEATVRIEPGHRWPARFDMTIGGRTAVRARVFPEDANETISPDWLLGDRWTVEATIGDRAEQWDYEVAGQGRIDGRRTWEVRVTARALPAAGGSVADGDGAPAGPTPARALHIDRASGALLAWDLILPGTGRPAQRFWNPRGADVFLWTEPHDPQVLDMPLLPPGDEDRTREVPEHEDTASPAITQRCRFLQGGQRVEVTMGATIEDPEGRRRSLRARQVWEEGSPWWREAERIVDDEPVVVARLMPGHANEEDPRP